MKEDSSENWKEFFSKLIENVNERMDRHSGEYNENFKNLFSKIDGLKDKIHAVEIEAEKKDKALWVKVASMTGLSTLASGISLFINQYFKH